MGLPFPFCSFCMLFLLCHPSLPIQARTTPICRRRHRCLSARAFATGGLQGKASHARTRCIGLHTARPWVKTGLHAFGNGPTSKAFKVCKKCKFYTVRPRRVRTTPNVPPCASMSLTSQQCWMVCHIYSEIHNPRDLFGQFGHTFAIFSSCNCDCCIGFPSTSNLWSAIMNFRWSQQPLQPQQQPQQRTEKQRQQHHEHH